MKVQQFTTSNGSVYQMYQDGGDRLFRVRRLPGKPHKTTQALGNKWRKATSFRDTGWGISIDYAPNDQGMLDHIHTTVVVKTEVVDIEV